MCGRSIFCMWSSGHGYQSLGAVAGWMKKKCAFGFQTPYGNHEKENTK
jgi:hypothetical protein